MGTCMSAPLPPNVFKVTPANNEKHNMQNGVLIVTRTELRYIDSHTETQLEWPLKYIRNWAYDEKVFYFEAGKKCLGGEGLYTFNADRARLLYEMVSENMSLPREGSVVSHHSLPSKAQPSPTLPARPNATSTLPPLPPPPQPSIALPSNSYQVLEFDKEPKLYPAPNQHATSNYTAIDFNETEKLNSRKKNGSVSIPITTLDSKRQASVSRASMPRKSSRSSLDSLGNVVDSKHGSATNLSSGTALPPGGQTYQNMAFSKQGTPGSSTPQSNSDAAEQQHNYSNIALGPEAPAVTVSPTPQDGHSSYSNITLGPAATLKGSEASVSTKSENASPEMHTPAVTSAPQNGHNSYSNMTFGAAGSELSSTPLTQRTTSTSSTSVSTKTPGREVPTPILTSTPQEGHGNYANIVLGPARSSGSSIEVPSTPQGSKLSVSVHGSGNYPELDLSSLTTVASSPRGSLVTVVNPIPEASTAEGSAEVRKGTGEGSVTEAATADRLRDEGKVNYGTLDFSAMKGLEMIQKERELLKQSGGETITREKEKSSGTHSHKKQK